jgi:hypothetical protein
MKLPNAKAVLIVIFENVRLLLIIFPMFGTQEKLQVMEERFKTEKERFGLVLQRAQTSTNINDDLRKEYETQLAIFKVHYLLQKQNVTLYTNVYDIIV